MAFPHRTSSRRMVRGGGPAALPLLLDQLGDEAGPAGLVARAQARTVVAVEVLVEEQMVAPVRVDLDFLRPAEDRPPALLVAQEDADQPPGELVGDLIEAEELARAGRALHPEIVAVVVVELLDRLD